MGLRWRTPPARFRPGEGLAAEPLATEKGLCVGYALPALPAGALRFVKVDVQGSEWQVLRGMRATLARQPGVVMTIEVFPGGLRGAGASARLLMETLADLGLGGWEFDRHRVLPIGAPWTYDLMTGGMTDVIVSREVARLRDLISRWRGISMKSTR